MKCKKTRNWYFYTTKDAKIKFVYRLEEINTDKLVVSSSYTRRKIQKSHQTIDYSDLEYSPQRKGSGDSLTSQRSLESQQSSDSHSSVTVSFKSYKLF